MLLICNVELALSYLLQEAKKVAVTNEQLPGMLEIFLDICRFLAFIMQQQATK